MYDFAVVGGDMRAVLLAGLLREKGYAVACALLERETECVNIELACETENIILPHPLFRNGRLYAPYAAGSHDIGGVLRLQSGGRIFAGGDMGPSAYNYAAAEGFVESIVLLSAQCAALSGRGADKARIAVTGVGPAADAAAGYFAFLGAAVVRVPCDEIDVSALLCRVDGVINTLPDGALCASVIERLPPHAVIIDLAETAGVDYEAAMRCKIRAERAGDLAGRMMPGAVAAAGGVVGPFQTIAPR